MNAHQYAEDFVGFLNEAMTGFHAVDASKKRLKSAGFHQISEFDEWELQPEGKYFFVRNDTTVIAFTIGNHISNDTLGYTVLGAHTDSPCLKVGLIC
ncbi:hypothetical protein EON65_06045 [archaeon]|nr:MAG: hypothetical protein EON65_06045 [archaeon]